MLPTWQTGRREQNNTRQPFPERRAQTFDIDKRLAHLIKNYKRNRTITNTAGCSPHVWSFRRQHTYYNNVWAVGRPSLAAGSVPLNGVAETPRRDTEMFSDDCRSGCRLSNCVVRSLFQAGCNVCCLTESFLDPMRSSGLLAAIRWQPEFVPSGKYARIREMNSRGSAMQKYRSVWLHVLAGVACCIAPFSLPPAIAAEKTIHAFRAGNDGASPFFGGLISDSAGNMYGTTSGGGNGDGGTVFKLKEGRKKSVLYAFKGGSDGVEPFGSLTMDASGNLYGTTAFGGGGTGCDNGSEGGGTGFKLAPDGTETVLYAFQGGSDGFGPGSNIVMDQSGNLYGTTAAGGTYNSDCGSFGCGTIFEVQPDGTKITLDEFQAGTDGAGPTGPLI